VTEILAPFDGHFDPSADPATAYTLLVHHLCMRRNKRCLLAYHRVRVSRIEELCWSGGGDAFEGEDRVADKYREDGGAEGEQVEGAGVHGNDGSTNALSPEEEDYARGYNDVLAAVKGQWTDIDLTGTLEPPRDLFIDVRVLKDAGEIQTEYGAINLTKNSQFFARQGDVERLIAQGFLQKLN